MTEQPSPAQLVAASPAAAAPQQLSAVRLLEHIRRCVRFDPASGQMFVQIHEGSATMADIDAVLAASPAAVDLPEQIVEAIAKQWDGCMTHIEDRGEVDIGAEIRSDGVPYQFRAASPVAPVGAPTEEVSEIAEEYSASRYGGTADSIIAMSKEIQRLRALLSRQGCELATDAREQRDQTDSSHLAMSTSSVPTAAPLLSSREKDRSELPREPLPRPIPNPDHGAPRPAGYYPQG